MYLALLPDADSIAALRHFAPTLPSDAHVTIIHSKAPKLALPLPTWSGAMTLKTNGVASFGWKPKLVLRLNVLNNELIAVRTQTETILRDAGLVWSAEWLFSPHITIGSQRAKMAPPTTLRFDRMEWR